MTQKYSKMAFGFGLMCLLLMSAAMVSTAADKKATAPAKKPTLPEVGQSDDRWLSLFDGKTTKGWTPRGEVVSFKAVDGELQLLSKKNVWVTTDVVMSDFEISIDARIPNDADGHYNSGLAFRCVGKTGKPKGYQCEIDGGNPGKDGGCYGIGLGGWLYPTAKTNKEYQARIKEAYKPKDWNNYRVHCEGDRIRIYVNDKLITDIKNNKSLRGYFGIQHHGRGGTMRFKNIRVKDLSRK